MESGESAPLPINPYAPPGIFLSDYSAGRYSDDHDGPDLLGEVWRDEMLLVVPSRGPLALPAVCIKTGRPLTRRFTTPQTITLLPLGHPLANEKWPVSREWEEAIPLSQLLGMVLCSGGFLLLIASLALAAARVPLMVGGPFGAMALFSIFAGLFLLAVSYRVFLTAVQVESSYVWLEGAHPDFLKELPRWTATTGAPVA